MSTSRTIFATSAALLAALALSACGTTPIESSPDSATPEPTTSEEASDFNRTDVMYAEMMIPHHEQAIEMSDIIIDTEGVSTETVALAEQIKAAQGPEIEQLDGLLESWGFDSMAGRDVDGMGNMDGMGGMGMNGMMSEEDMEALEDASGADAERLFLESMIEHHEGAVDMSEPVLTDGQSPELIELAGEIIDAQLVEIETMKDLLARL